MKPPRTLGDLVTANVDPLLRKRTGLKGDLIAQWQQIAGDDIAAHCQPVQLRWPKPLAIAAMEEDAQPPATLVVSATGIWALRVQHSTGEIIARINRYFGYEAISRIAIEQRAVSTPRPRRVPSPSPARLQPHQTEKIDALVEEIEDEQLRETMRKLGRVIHADQSSKR